MLSVSRFTSQMWNRERWDAYTLYIQHGPNKLSATEDFNRAISRSFSPPKGVRGNRTYP